MLIKVNGFPISAPYGSIDSVHPASHPHTGIDLAIQQGVDILSPVHGIVDKIVDYGSTSIGKGVFVKFNNSQELIFGHLSKISVHKGDIIEIGQKLGEAGSTGCSTGSHLHLALKNLVTGHFQDPTLYERAFQKLYFAVDTTINNSHHLSSSLKSVGMMMQALFN